MNNPPIYTQLILHKGAKNINCNKDSISINGAGKTGHPYAEDWNLTPYTKNQLEIDQRPRYKTGIF